jgi:nitroimidazol reductase NimA-like FMN-containing flavoprotein (pyridoxamine 5'-phosphate oxidase superfamily)
MRRKEREITGIDEIEAIISRCDVCRIALADDNLPYIVTMNFGYSGGAEKKVFFPFRW